jgi:hypothetical protein
LGKTSLDTIANGHKSQAHLLAQIGQQWAGVSTRMPGHFQIEIDEPQHLRRVIAVPATCGFRTERVAHIGSNRR